MLFGKRTKASERNLTNEEIQAKRAKEKEEKKLAKKEKAALEEQRKQIHYEMIDWQIRNEKKEKVAPEGYMISLQHVNKIYPNHVQAVYDFNLNVKEHEFIVFVGPSGCGKSTTLRMIAGLEDITAGDLYISGKHANDLLPKERDIAMVFQNYALYPNMNVYDNLAFALRVRKIPEPLLDKNGNQVLKINEEKIKTINAKIKTIKSDKELLESIKDERIAQYQKQIDEIKANPEPAFKFRSMTEDEVEEKVMKIAKTLELEDYLDRKPAALSGGQRQRVALGRAIVRDANVFLMDEPLSNLDAKLRVQMRGEIVKLHKSINATTIYVTHDQIEAMTMADRIVVMKKGYVQQIGTPKEIYNNPANIFVATFIGSPAMNIIECRYKNGTLIFEDGSTIEISEERRKAHDEFYEAELKDYIEEYEYVSKQYETRLEELKSDKKGKFNTEDLTVLLTDSLLYAFSRSKEEVKEKIDELSNYKEEHSIFFGIRPEDIVSGEAKTLVHNKIEGIKLNIELAELLGNEYYIHTKFGNKDIVAKAGVNQNLENGNVLEAIFNDDNIHIFDKTTEKLIF